MNNTPKSHILIIIVICFISLIFSIAAIIRTFSRENLEIDYLGLIVGVLSFLVAFVTIIFGYNMYGLKESLKRELNSKFQNDMSNLRLDFEKNTSIIKNEITKSVHASLYHRDASNFYEKRLYMDSLYKALKAIECEYSISQRSCTGHCIYIIYSIVKGNKLCDVEISVKEKNKLIKIISMCDHKRTDEIIDYISNLRVLK